MRSCFCGRDVARIAAVALLALAPGSIARNAQADDVQACLEAHEKSQVLKREGKLLDARDQLIVCARDVCPGMIRKECGPWLGQVNDAMPTLTFSARKDKRDLTDVRVSMDGELLANQLDGRAVDVDPGQHTFRFEAAGLKAIELKVVVREGEKAREVVADFGGNGGPSGAGTGAESDDGSTTPGADAGMTRPVPMLTYVLGGVGIAALAGSAFFEARGISKRSDLDSQGCKPFCPQDDVDAAKQSILIGDIALGVGVLSLGAATYFYFTRPEVPSGEKPATSSIPRFDVRSVTGGAMAGVSGSF